MNLISCTAQNENQDFRSTSTLEMKLYKNPFLCGEMKILPFIGIFLILLFFLNENQRLFDNYGSYIYLITS